ncbi:MAG TPA: protein phosphatase 2C domain-containing protein [Actinophytocola sp.]|nr:protein phosphatase 2C domain-containing protein [Actinophytocola sp.]
MKKPARAWFRMPRIFRRRSEVPRVEIAAATVPRLAAGQAAVPDVAAHRRRIGPVNVVVASVIGQRHLLDGELREDGYALAVSHDQTACVVAVADGVGSSVNAHEAAAVASSTVVASAMRWIADRGTGWEDHSARLVRDASEAVRGVRDHGDRRAETASGKTAPPASTLTVAVLMTSNEGTEVCWLAYGDSAALVLSVRTRQWRWLSTRDEMRVALTRALPGEPSFREHGTLRLGRDDVLVLATDGVAEPIEHMPEPFATAIIAAVTEEMSAAKFATLLDFDMAGMVDDRTILAIWHPGLSQAS